MEVAHLKRQQDDEYWQTKPIVIDGGQRIQLGGRRFSVELLTEETRIKMGVGIKVEIPKRRLVEVETSVE
ncbi:MAG: hypothetical protein NTY75_03075 [Candidatus Shapirobacteria bacterium]|nr:hypothetical protein [Candidatus Shapirobacteria bacterium]